MNNHDRKTSRSGCLFRQETWNGIFWFVLLVSLMGCETVKARFDRTELPNLGPPLPLSARMEFDPSLINAKPNYVDSCNHPMDLPLGSILADTLLQAAHQTFTTVSGPESATANDKPDIVVYVRLLDPRLKIYNEGLYDRVPAELTLDAIIQFRDPSGKLLREVPLQAARKERLLVEPTQKRCAYSTIDSFAEDTASDLAGKFMVEARTAAGAAPAPQAAPAAPAQQPVTQALVPQPVPAPLPAGRTTTPSLSFKATILDENSNLLLEGGERIRVRVDVVNTGSSPVQNASASLSGTPSLLSHFPATQLSVGLLQPGETKTVDFVATLPQSVKAQRAEMQVSLGDSSGSFGLPTQTLAAVVRPAGTKSDDVDVAPVAAAGFHRPQTYLVSIGLSSYRDPNIAARKFAALDAEMIASYFQSVGGVPAKNVRLIQDWKALRPDIEEALLDWIPPRITSESVVLVYFAGHAMVAPSGDVFLVPYDGSLSGTARLYPLKDLDAALARLKTKHTLFIFDGVVAKLGTDAKAKGAAPRWNVTGGGGARLIGLNGLGKGVESEKMRHGLFTYYLLRGLRGDADLNHNGEITIGELAAYVQQEIPSTAKTSFNQEQRPLVTPPFHATDKIAELVLSKPASIAGR